MISLEINTIINDRYQLESKLGEGGMGIVYQARDLKLDRSCAIKVLRQTITSEHAIQRFQAEWRFITRLNSPYIVQVTDADAYQGQLYIVMELIEGDTLTAILKREGPLPLRRALRLVKSVLSGLAEAHTKGVVHRDLKPANILVVETHGGEEIPKILDFGIAKDIESDDGIKTQTSMYLGTPKYMAPEQFTRDPVNQQTDFYALGLILYQMITGRFPLDLTFSDLPDSISNLPPEVKLGWLHLNRVIEPLNIEPSVDELLTRLLAKQQGERPENALILIGELNRLLDSLPAQLLDQIYQGDALDHAEVPRSDARQGAPESLVKPQAGSQAEAQAEAQARGESVTQSLDLSARAAQPQRSSLMKWAALLVVISVIGVGAWYGGLFKRTARRAQPRVVIQPSSGGATGGASKTKRALKRAADEVGVPHRVKIVLKPDQVSYQFDTPVQVSARVYDRQKRELKGVEVRFVTQGAYLKVNEFNDLEFKRAGRSQLKACVKATGDAEICDQVPVMVLSDSSL